MTRPQRHREPTISISLFQLSPPESDTFVYSLNCSVLEYLDIMIARYYCAGISVVQLLNELCAVDLCIHLMISTETLTVFHPA